MQKYLFLLQKTPTTNPVLKVLDNFKVIPESLARYLPPERINLTPEIGVSQIKFKMTSKCFIISKR